MLTYRSKLAPHIVEYIRHREASDRWNDGYGRVMRAFDNMVSEAFPDDDQLSQQMVDRWCSKRDSESNNTCRSRSWAVVGFVRYLRERGLSDVEEPELPRKERCTYVPHAFTEEELARFFRACDSIVAHPGNKASINRKLTVPVFFRLLYSSGMRTTEARKLRVADVDLERGVVDVRLTKGRDQHYVALHESMRAAMERYDAAIGRLFPGREYFFPGIRSPHHAREWVEANFNALWEEANGERGPGTVAYALRHNYAIENINGWAGCGFSAQDKLLYLSKSMGHRSVESTAAYYSYAPALDEAIEAATGESFDWIVPEV